MALILVGCTVPSSPSGQDGTGAGSGSTDDPASEEQAGAGVSGRDEPSPESVSGDATASPVGVSIPGIGVSGNLLELGLTEERTLEVPQDADRMGWYAGGGRPGGPGPTVIVGHVDSEEGPAVFYRLPEMTAGDTVQVELSDGGGVTYVVDRVADFPKDDFPTEDVFGASSEDVLRLITCTGPWRSSEESYRDNRVVYASAIEASAIEP